MFVLRNIDGKNIQLIRRKNTQYYVRNNIDF